jgi:hypothetical protein
MIMDSVTDERLSNSAVLSMVTSLVSTGLFGSC